MSKWNWSTGLIEAFRSVNVTAERYLITGLSDIFLNNGGIFNLSIVSEILIEKRFYTCLNAIVIQFYLIHLKQENN